MGGKSTDFGEVASAQGDANQQSVTDQLYANRPTQYTPWGYTDWQTQEGGVDAEGNPITNWTQTQGLSPELMDIYNKQVAIQGGRTDVAGMLTGRMGGEFGEAPNWDNLNPMGQVPTHQYTLPEGGIDDPYQTRQAAEDASYQSAMNRVTPRFDEQRRSMEVKMRNQGLGPEDQAWKSQMEGIGNAENDATNQALWGANTAGRQESSQMYDQQLGLNKNTYEQALKSNFQNWDQSMQGSKYANTIRQQQMTEQMQQRGFSLNEINALLNGQQVQAPQMPNFAQGGAAQPAPIYNAAVDSASSENAANPLNALLGAAGSAGGAYLGNASWT